MAVYIISSGNNFDFDLTQVEPDGAALVNDLSIIKGTPTYTLTVSTEQTEGVYTLAEGAAKFKSTITVKNTYGDELGTLKLGEKVYIGKNDYTLTLTDDVLSVAINAPTVTHANGDVLLDGTMPMARYMYGCVNTSIAMILGYYDLYGYRGKVLSDVIEGDVELDSRGWGPEIFNMDDFDSNLGKANASRDYVERFFSKDSIESINARTNTETTPAEELPYSFVDDGAGTELRTDVWNCLADYLGTGQFWRGNANLHATSDLKMLEVIMNDNEPFTVTDEATGIQRTIEHKYTSCLYGLYLYLRDKGYDLDRKTTKICQVDVAGGQFTFEDYRKEIDAGRPVMILIKGHAMVGYGYNAETREIIFDNCLIPNERMCWDGTYNYGTDRPLEAICTFGFMTSDADVDLAVSPFDEESGAAGKLIVTTAEGQTESADYCFAGSPLYLSFAVSNLGTSASGAFDVSIYCDGAEIENIPSLSLEPGAIKRMSDIPLAADFGVGLHSISVRIDPDNEIQEMYALNNSDERSVMVLKEGTNVVEGTKTVVSGEVSKDDYVMNGAGIQVLEGGTAEATLIQGKVTSRSLDGSKVEFAPGFVNVSMGGLIRNADVYEYGQLELSGTAEDLVIREHGNAVVSSGGIVSGASVDKNGTLDVESGGMLTGWIDVESGANIVFEEGGILNFDLTGTTAGAALVNDLSIIEGTPIYTLTVSAEQAKGAYTLAEGAAKFKSTITVKNTYGDELGTLTVGGELETENRRYALNLEDDHLCITCYALSTGRNIENETVTVTEYEIYREAVVNSTGKLYVNSGGTATEVVENGGYVSASEDAEVSFAPNAISDLNLSNASATVHSGTSATDTTVNSGGNMTVSSGGIANNTTVNDYGKLYVSSGGTANNTTVNTRCSMGVESGGTANSTMVYEYAQLYVSSGATATNVKENGGDVYVADGADVSFVPNIFCGLFLAGNSVTTVHSGTTANSTMVYEYAKLLVSSGGTASNNTVISLGYLYVFSGGIANNTTVEDDGNMYVSSGGTATDIVASERAILMFVVASETLISGTLAGSAFEIKDGIVSHYSTNRRGTLWIDSGGTANDVTINSRGSMYVSSGGVANSTMVTDGRMWVSSGGIANSTLIDGGIVYVSPGGMANNTTVNSIGWLEIRRGGTADETKVKSDGSMYVSSKGKITGEMVFEDGAIVSAEEGAIFDFDISGLTAEAGARVNNLAIIRGTPVYTLTVSAEQAKGVYTLAEGAAGFDSTITVQNTLGDELGMLTAGETLTIDKTDYLLTNENGVLSVTVSDGGTPAKPKWTYMVYMAADSNIGTSALYDIIGMQQAEVDSEIDIYVLADRCAVDAGYPDEIVTVNGTYKWDSLWPDTRVGKITYSPGLTVTVAWESWGELDTASSETLKRFVDWVQEESPAENYGLILWDHGEEDGELCWDLTTDPNWNACFKVSEVSDLLNEKGNIPIVIFNNCLLASEIVATQLAGSTEVIVASEPVSMGESTYNYHAFFNTITAGMTPQEMAEIMVRNVISPGMLTMLSSIDVRDSRLGDALEVLADAVAEADNDADKTVLTNAMLKAYQDGFCYTGSLVQQSDLGYMIQQAMADGSFDNTSEGFKKALADVKTVLEEVVLAVRSVPVKRGTGIAYCNTIATLLQCAVTGRTPEKMDSLIKSHIISSYKSNPLWGGLLYDLGSTFLNRNADQLFRPASFHVIDVEGLVEGRTVAAMDLGCFSGMGEQNYGIALIGDAFCRIVITDEDKSTGIISVGNESGKEIKVSLLAADGSIVVAENTNGISFKNLAPGDYYIRLLSETNCDVTVTFDANWMTGVDRFDYAGSGQNLPGVNGNGSIDTATILDAGYYTGLLTGKGDTDFYRVGNIHTEQYTVVINGREDWTVAEYDENGTLVREGQYSELDNYITLTMDSMNYLLVEGTADPSKQEVNRYFLNIFKNKNGSGGVVQLDDLTGSKDEVSWESSTISEYVLECSTDGFEHVLQYTTNGTAIDLLNLPAGTYQWRVKANMDSAEWNDGNEIVSDNTSTNPKVFRSKADASDDIFFATPVGTWDNIYYAQNVGSVNDWTGTNEIVSANGKGRIQDLFFGSADPSTLCLTDSENGDALFLDDMYTGLPEDIEDNTGRLFRLQSIMAGAGDDIIDMTSQRFGYSDGNLSIFGGDGDDIIWASKGRNLLYGDAGNDRIVGASSNDVIVGGIGNDRMHGGGGDDIFTFGENWGMDTVEQLATGSVTLWFTSGSMENWDKTTLTYTDGDNNVKVSGVTADKITLKFGDDGSEPYATLSEAGAFKEFTSQKIFEESKGMLA